MLFAVDIGNTTILFAGLSGQKVLFYFRTATDKGKLAAEYTAQLKDLLRVYDPEGREAEGAVLSSVVPELTGALETAVERVYGVKAAVIKRDIRPDFPIDLDYPASIGSDRVADAAAVIREYPLPAIIFDLGTATTCSVIDEAGVFRGGLISPGVRTASEALRRKASQLSSYELGRPLHLIGKNTEECMNSGIVYGHAAMIDGLIRRIERRTGKRYTVILTGGLSDLIGEYCECQVVVDKFLILKGLCYLYENQEKTGN
ncbi:MAG: type III pantothenate kinase [Lachnospiraceae bacterium]|nr:type III pantothenate kinase [Lachnospiraceae bacterium]